MARGSYDRYEHPAVAFKGVGKAREGNGKIRTGRSGRLVRWMYQTEQGRTGRQSARLRNTVKILPAVSETGQNGTLGGRQSLYIGSASCGSIRAYLFSAFLFLYIF